KDAPGVAKSMKKLLPYLPAVGRWAVSEGVDMVPGLLQSFRARIEEMVKPTAAEVAAVEQAERVTTELDSVQPIKLRKNVGDAQRLQVVA
ncbi:MAG TPA: hypothetical protein VK509_09435, partial [Polyangiales bacterium]|nr:hypothetical protein [Polyangiales bacterium]